MQECLGCGDQYAWREALQLNGRRSCTEVGGDLGGDRRGEPLGEVRAGHALGYGAAEQPGGVRHGEQGSDAASAGGLAEHGDIRGVTAEGGDVVLYPPQRGDLVENATVVRRSRDMCEALCAEAVVHADHHHTVLGQRRTVVMRVSGAALQIATAMDPHHHRQPSGTEVR